MSRSNITNGAIISYVSTFLNIIISFVYTPWMIHKIGAADYGLYTLVYSFLSYFLLDFGISLSIVRFLSKYRAEGDEQRASNLIVLTTKIFLFIDIIIFLFIFCAYFFLEKIFLGLTPSELETLKKLYIIAGMFSVMSFAFRPFDGAMLAYEFFVPNKLLDMIHKVGAVVLICLALSLHGNVVTMVFIMGITGFATSIGKYLVFRHKSSLKFNWSFFDKTELGLLISFAFWAFFSSLAQRLRLNLVPTVLGIFANSSEISIFSLGMTFESMIFTISYALNGLFLPRVSKLVGDNDKDSINSLMVKLGRLQLLMFSLIFFGFFVFGHQFLTLWVGEGFENVYYVVLLLIMTNFISLTQYIAENVIYAENKIKDYAIRIFVTSLLGLALACIFSRRLGAVGGALGTFGGLLLFQFVINYYYYRELRIDLGLFFRKCHLSLLPLLTVYSLAFYFIFHRFIHIDGWVSLIGCILLFSLVYCVVAYTLLLNVEEKRLLHNVLSLGRRTK